MIAKFALLIICIGSPVLALAQEAPSGAETFVEATRTITRAGAHNQQVDVYLNDRDEEIGLVVWARPGIRDQMISLKNGKKNGANYEWYTDEKNNLMTMDVYEGGIRHGEWRRWARDGRLEGSGLMVRGSGLVETFHNNQKLKLVERYQDNEKNGPRLEYHENGVIKSYNTYKNGRQYGTFIGKDIQGNVADYGFLNENGRLHGISFRSYRRRIEGKMEVLCAFSVYNDGTVEWETDRWTEVTALPVSFSQYQGIPVSVVVSGLPLPEEYKKYDNQR